MKVSPQVGGLALTAAGGPGPLSDDAAASTGLWVAMVLGRIWDSRCPR